MDTWRPSFASVAVLGLGLLVLRSIVRTLRPSLFPPGPPRLPIIGNLHQIPRTAPHIRFTEWNRTYGEVVGLLVFGQPALVLGSHRAVREILEKRAATSSLRPRLVMVEDVCQIGKFASLNSDMDLHKHYRRMFAHALGSRAVQTYWPIQMREMRRAVLEMLGATDDAAWLVCVKRAVASITSQIVYAYDAKTEDDAFIAKVTRILRSVEKTARPGEYIVEGLTFLKQLPTWFPGAGFKREGLRIKQDCRWLIDEPYDDVKQKLVAGEAAPCFVSNLLQDESGHFIADMEEEERVKWAAGVLFGGGTDTTVAAIQMFLVAMLLFPNVQKNAQAEMDRVIGKDRLPSLEDRELLPYCSALLQETLRWNPVVPLCIPHVLTQDEPYDGYVLPRGSIVIANSWALARDPAVYPDPEAFKPERFLAPDGKTLTSGEDGREVFGFGRRVCPGNYLAEASLFAFVCTFIWAANLTGSPEWDGAVPEFEGGIVNRPIHIPADIRPRTSHSQSLLKSTVLE
ncbi:cytochrome P450 [Calocera viscosa TUFC12733]|uniref:Cytochrome P450 n=1 Tax=Calocera viscosa (strain TUFC12733) TaxID=1330018 RepID=A0A167QEW0_CALVF|nr:cytochrome P450 [Calocera viscosa TUFC12733]